ncbi:hypothetical protein AB4320_05590 [Vibrio splendidus]
MATIGQIRGAVLEEAVLFLLDKVGYKIVRNPSDSISHVDIEMNSSGLELRGRGTWHQIDAIAEQHHTPAFTYPLRLLVEAKYYTTKKVGVDVVRNSVGVHKDLSENYFSITHGSARKSGIRFNYQSAIFSVSGYTRRAVEYAVAHQIFLIEYKNIALIEPIISGIGRLEESSFTEDGISNLTVIRQHFLRLLNGDNAISSLLTEEGQQILQSSIIAPLSNIGGSYFGMLQGRWPLHLLTAERLPENAFVNDTVRCRLSRNNQGQWYFSPTEFTLDSPNWFELEFNLPPELAQLIAEQHGDREGIANTKSENFSFIALSGIIGGIWRNVRVELDRNWLERYLSRANA